MSHKRSKGVTFWAWFVIIVSTLRIFGIIYLSHYFINFMLNLVIDAVFLICGILLLKLIEPARKVFVFLLFINFPWYLLLLFYKRINIDGPAAVTGGLTGLLVNLILIYFFTRPKVKEQFRTDV